MSRILHEVMSSVEVSNEFGIKPNTVRKAIARGQISHRKLDIGEKLAGLWIVPRDEATELWGNGPRRAGRKPAGAD